MVNEISQTQKDRCSRIPSYERHTVAKHTEVDGRKVVAGSEGKEI